MQWTFNFLHTSRGPKEGMTPGTHVSSFGGNFLAASVAKAVVSEVSNPNFIKNVVMLGKVLKSKIEDLCLLYPSIITGIRGKGLMLGIKCKKSNTELSEKLRDEGLLTVAAGDNILRLLPPLNIEIEHIEVCVNIISKVLMRMDKN